jgi:citrate synthase
MLITINLGVTDARIEAQYMSTKEWISTDEAAVRLGVKHETLYAYVSRGIVTRRLAESGKGSEFSRKEIERLALSRGSRPGKRGAFDVTIATSISMIDGDELFFRGVPIAELVAASTFEDTADLVWDGTDGEWPKTPLTRVPGLNKMRGPDRMRITVAYDAAKSSARIATAPPLVRATTRSVITSVACSVGDGAPTSIASILAGANASPKLIRLFDIALLTMTDHEMATSTLAARVAASTRAGVHDVILAGLGTIAGPLHGSAGRLSHDLLVRAQTIGAEPAVEELLRNGQRLPGLGHQVYQKKDPRTQPMLDALFAVISPAKRTLITDVHAAMLARVPKLMNCDSPLGAMSFALDRSPDLAEIIFSTARMAGWVAHALEEYEEQPLRYRGRAVSL